MKLLFHQIYNEEFFFLVNGLLEDLTGQKLIESHGLKRLFQCLFRLSKYFRVSFKLKINFKS